MIKEILLRDQTTGKNILWANAEHGAKEIQPADVELIKPRWQKLREHQKQRTRDRAEIFTPPNICKLQNNLLDVKRTWTDYVDAKILEIACGEAPYLVSRYNAVTGEPIPIEERKGILDRKLRVVTKETSAPNDWTEYAVRAVQSIYGYEFQGDNLFLARQNVFETFKDYYRQKFSKEPPAELLLQVAEIISWNLFQMDGMKNTIPYADTNPNISLFNEETHKSQGEIYCKIKDWSKGEVKTFKELTEGGRR